MREEYPDPQNRRRVWQTLNGEWEFRFGDAETDAYPLKIRVPFAYQSKASGIGDVTRHDILWYRRKFVLTEEMKRCRTVRLNFLAVDYACRVFVNKKFAVGHEGGYGRFGADITEYLIDAEEQEIEIRVYDPMTKVYPRGKQNWREGQQRCWYYCTSGIWQSVWLDGANGDYITELQITPDVFSTAVSVCAETEHDGADELCAVVQTPQGAVRAFSSKTKDDGRFRMDMAFDKPDCIDDVHLWRMETPRIYQMQLAVKKDGEILDEMSTYFAFRKIHTHSGKVYVNDTPIEFRLILNQGYWEGYGMTAPRAECYKEDILIAKEMGFNGMRVHQKLDDPWLYYYADMLGFYIWAETPSAYDFRPDMIRAVTQTQTEIVRRVYNNPSVVAYVPLNESWGVKEIQHDKREQAFARSLYWLIKSLDGSRLVITNDGWENLGLSDLIGIHDYSKYGDEFPRKFSGMDETLVPAGRRLMVQGDKMSGQPIILSEFGGISLASDSGWGYGGAESGVDSFMARFERLYRNISACDFCGWCYTQLTDVEQETNGLLDANHKPKFDVKKVREILDKYSKKFY